MGVGNPKLPTGGVWGNPTCTSLSPQGGGGGGRWSAVYNADLLNKTIPYQTIPYDGQKGGGWAEGGGQMDNEPPSPYHNNLIM